MYDNPFEMKTEECRQWEDGYSAGYWGYGIDDLSKKPQAFQMGYNYFWYHFERTGV